MAFTQWLEGSLDGYAATHANPGRAALRHLNRAEYPNTVRNLRALDVGLSRELPADESGYGFDTIADVLSLSPTLMDRYLAMVGKLSRLAAALGHASPHVTSYTIPKDGSIRNQGLPACNEHSSDALPLDSLGSDTFRQYALQDGWCEISGTLNADINNEVDRMKEDRHTQRVTSRLGRIRSAWHCFSSPRSTKPRSPGATPPRFSCCRRHRRCCRRWTMSSMARASA